MEYKFSQEHFEKISADVAFVVAFAREGEGSATPVLRKPDGGELLDKALNSHLSQALRDQEFKGKEGDILFVNTLGKTGAKNIAVIGLGLQKNFDLETLRRLGGFVAQAANKIKAKTVAGMIDGGNMGGFPGVSRLQAFVEGMEMALYQFQNFKIKKNGNQKLKTCFLKTAGNIAPLKKGCAEGRAIVEGVNLARELANLPPNILTPTRLGKEGLNLAKAHKNIRCQVWNEAKLRTEKMGALLAVAQGAKTPPVFIRLSYQPSGKPKTKVALVGKGITFDSGGLNLKTRDQEFMKIDMGGAAAVIGIFKALAVLKPKVAVEGFIPSCENMPSGSAYRPSDIITTRAGKTVEIINTDAEGRLALADALDVACESHSTYMIDMATLTGGAAYALGELWTPILGNDPRLVQRLLAAAKKAGEPSWELPIVQEYKKGYLSGPADLKNSGSGTKASTISGALFLEEFVGKNKWAHMDIASTAWADKANAYHTFVGATGTPVRTIVYFLKDL